MPQRYKLDEFSLGAWVRAQRETKDSMSSERKQRLDEIGFIWDAFTEAWDKGFGKLLQFKTVEGHCRVPFRSELDGFKLGRWVHKQRPLKATMSPERKQRLDDIGFIWDASKGKT